MSGVHRFEPGRGHEWHALQKLRVGLGVETHQIARTLRSSGKAVWQHRLQVERRTGDFEWSRDRFAAALRSSRWYKASVKDDENEYDAELWQLWDEIKDSEDVDHYNAVLDSIYDLADLERCLIYFVEA